MPSLTIPNKLKISNKASSVVMFFIHMAYLELKLSNVTFETLMEKMIKIVRKQFRNQIVFKITPKLKIHPFPMEIEYKLREKNMCAAKQSK